MIYRFMMSLPVCTTVVDFFTLSEHLLKTAKRQQKGLIMLYGDLDGLKGINDILGHQKGDWALIDIANILKETFRDSDMSPAWRG